MKINYFKIVLPFFLLATIIFSCKKENSLPDPLQAGWNNKAVCELLEENENIRRSEEHTSELQSRSDLVCRLLLEKKKKIK